VMRSIALQVPDQASLTRQSRRDKKPHPPHSLPNFAVTWSCHSVRSPNVLGSEERLELANEWLGLPIAKRGKEGKEGKEGQVWEDIIGQTAHQISTDPSGGADKDS
jgi:hypothetical protein